MATTPTRVTVTGAAGQIGYSLLFRIASGQMLGPKTDIELRLLELEAALGALEGTAMELEDCAFPLLKNIVCTSDLDVAFEGTHWALLVGAVPRKAGMERGDLLKVNGGIFTPQGEAIGRRAHEGVRVLVVGNPCNTNALIALHGAKRVPRENFFAMTMLDENRARAQLAQKARVPVDKVTRMAIWGNHSATQWPDFTNALIDGRPCPEVVTDGQWLRGPFVETVQKRGAAIIKARGASSAASAANAIVDTVRNLTTETPPGEHFSVALCSKGEYGVDEGLIFSYPCRAHGGKVEVVEGIEQGAFGQEKFRATLEELRGERETVEALGLL